ATLPESRSAPRIERVGSRRDVGFSRRCPGSQKAGLVGRARRRAAERLLAGAVLAVALAAAGCGGNRQNALDAHSHPAKDIASLWWWMLGGAILGLALVVGMLVYGFVRRKRRGLVGDEPG